MKDANMEKKKALEFNEKAYKEGCTDEVKKSSESSIIPGTYIREVDPVTGEPRYILNMDLYGDEIPEWLL